MTDIPQLGPEVYVDDEDDIGKQARKTVSPLLSPMDISDPRSSFITHGLDAALGQGSQPSNSHGGPLSPLSPLSPSRISPQLSPHKPTNSAFSFEGGDGAGGASAGSSRRGSNVSAENVLKVLDNSAWGESIRRSFTMRRPQADRRGTGS
jgi:hypothetical protein